MTYSCGDLLARRDDARGGAGGEARPRLHEARRCRAASGVLDVGCGWGSFAMHAAQELRRPGRRDHAVARAGALARERVRGRGAGRPDRHPRCRTTATSPASRSTRSPRSAWSSTSARRRSTSTPRGSRALLKPGGRLLNHGITRLRHSDPAAGPFSERYVFPDGEPLHLSRAVLLALERAGFVTQHVEGFARRLRRDAAALGRPARRATSTRRCGSPARSACASGGSTCAPRATASCTGFIGDLPGARAAARRGLPASPAARRGRRAGAAQRGARAQA